MEFSILKEDLVKSLSLVVGPSFSAKGSKPYYQNVLLNLTEDDGLIMICVNGESEMKVTIPLDKMQIKSFGSISVSSKDFYEISKIDLLGKRKNVEDRIFFFYNEDMGRVQITRFKNVYDLNSLSPTAFPQSINCSYDCHFNLTEGELKDIIKTTQFSMAEGDSRLFLNGLFMEIKGNELYCVATDSHRLALNKFILLDKDTNSEDNYKVIISRAGVLELNKLISSCDNNIDISLSRTKIKFESDRFTFITSLLEGNYPNHNSLFPSESSFIGKIVVNCDDLKSAVKAATVLSRVEDEKLIIEASNERVQLLMKNSTHELAKTEIENVDYNGVPTRIGLNPRFLLNVLDNISCKSITISFNEITSVIELNENNNYCEMKFIIMLVVI